MRRCDGEVRAFYEVSGAEAPKEEMTDHDPGLVNRLTAPPPTLIAAESSPVNWSDLSASFPASARSEG